jgi:transposase-like protein
VSKTTISTITDKVLDGMSEWQNRPFDPVYPVVFIDCIHVKVRDGQVANRPIYIALAVTTEGNRDILGLWAGDGGEGAKYWLQVLTEIKNRGVGDVLMVVCDGLTGLPDAVNTVWKDTIVQTCVVHLMRNSFRYSARQDWDAISRGLKPVYQAATVAEAEERFLEFAEAWGTKYPAILRLWENAWAEFVPFLGFDREIRRIVCTTNAIESVNARIRKAVRARGHFPNEQAALKCVYPRRHGPRPHRSRQGPLDPALEASPQRIRHPIRRPPQQPESGLTTQPSYTVSLTDPLLQKGRDGGARHMREQIV